MKWTTANFINPNYTEAHEIFVGTHTGSFKKLSINKETPFAQQNLQELSALKKDSKVTSLDFGTDDNEILIGRENKFAQVYSLKTQNICSSIELLDTPIVGLARYESHLIAGFGTGKIQKLKEPEPWIGTAGDHMSRMRQCPMDRKLIATGGKERHNNLKIFNVETETQVFTSKNLPNDFLQLEVPTWDCDMGFFDVSTLATCSRYGYVRVYDTRKQRRPVQSYATEDQMSFTTLVTKGNYIYTGTTMGGLKAFDMRKLKNVVHTYKGFTGSISDLYLDESGKYLLSGSLDRYVRVHEAESCVLMYQCYVKSKATGVLLRSTNGGAQPKPVKEDSDDECVFLGEEKDEDEEEQVAPSAKDDEKDNDDEYENIFANMQTVCENESEDETTEKPTKRKTTTKSGKAKKKKKL